MTQVIPREAVETKPVVEGVNETPAETPKVSEEQLSPKFAALARQQKEIRRMQQELKAREDALKIKEQEYQTGYVPKKSLQADPLTALTDIGMSYDDIVKAAMAKDPTELALKKVYDKIQALEDTQSKTAEEYKVNQQKQYDQALNQIRNEAKLLVDSDANYETIKAQDASEAVVELIKDTFEKEGTLLSVEEAATQVEEYLLKEAVKLASLEKVKKQLTPQEAQGVDKAQPITQKQVQKTLTNANTMSPSKPTNDRERRERAILAFQGKL